MHQNKHNNISDGDAAETAVMGVYVCVSHTTYACVCGNGFMLLW